MTPQENTQLVQQIFEALGRGDIPFILNAVCEDVKWTNGFPRDVVPTGGVWHGPEGVAEFFANIGTVMEPTQFEPREYIAQDNKVVVLGYSSFIVKSIGKPFGSDWVMVWTLQDGKVKSFREYTDTAGGIAAFKGE